MVDCPGEPGASMFGLMKSLFYIGGGLNGFADGDFGDRTALWTYRGIIDYFRAGSVGRR